MTNKKQNIDDLLFQKLANSTADADGIDWNAFESKQKKKRVGFWFTTAAILAIVSVGSWFVYHSVNQTDPVKELTHEVDLPSETQQTLPIHVDTPKESQELLPQFEEITTQPTQPITGANKQKTKSKVSQTNHVVFVDTTPFQLVEIDALSNVSFLVNWPKLRPLTCVEVDSFDWIRNFGIGNEVHNKESFVRFGIGPSFVNPSFQITSKGAGLMHQDYLNIRGVSENATIGYSINASIGKQLGRWSPHVGLAFSQSAIFANYDYMYSDRPVLDLDGRILGYQSQTEKRIQYQNTHSYAMVEMPIGAGINLVTKPNWSLIFDNTFSPQMLLSAKGNLPDMVFLDKKEDLVASNFNLNSASYSAGIIFTRKMQNLTLYVEPQFSHNFGLRQVNDLYQTQFNMFIFTLGIQK